MAAEEFLLLQSYFCKPGELYLDVEPEKLDNMTEVDFIMTLAISIKKPCLTGSIKMQVRVTSLNVEKCFEHMNCISFMVEEGNEVIRRINLLDFKKNFLEEKDRQLANKELTFFSLLTWVPNAVEEFIDTKFEQGKDTLKISKEPANNDNWGAVICLDHIRSTKRYYKFFEDCSKCLHLFMHLLQHDSLIYLIVLGTKSSVQEYLKFHRTSLVDVDSSGKPCKEKMLKVIEHRALENDFIMKDTTFNRTVASNRSSLIQILKSYPFQCFSSFN